MDQFKAFIILVAVCLLVSVYLFGSKSFNKKIFYRWKKIDYKKHLLWFLLVTLATTLIILFFKNGLLLEFPLGKTQKYFLGLLLYPLISVIPQEIIYRSYFYHRFQKLFPNQRLMIFINSFAFGFLHIIFDNWVAPIGAFLINFIFSLTYLKSKSLPVVCVEHYLYGIMIFTIGMGHYFK